MVYRRHRHSEVWHVSELCCQWPIGPQWPAGGYEEFSTRPPFGRICTQCLRLTMQAPERRRDLAARARPQ